MCIRDILIDFVIREEELEMKRAKRKKYGKYAMIGAASVGGGVLLGVTGGLIAPLLGASIGALIGIKQQQ